MKVLIIDDSKPITTYVTAVLISNKIEVASAENGQVAADLLKQDKDIDLILLDWNMPILDGPGFLDLVKKEALTSAPIIMMTTNNKPEHIKTVLEKGAVEYIMKPFTEDILMCKINMVMDQCGFC